MFGLATEGGVVGWCAHRRVRMMNPAWIGIERVPIHPRRSDVREAAERFVQLAGWRGIFMIELLRNDAARPYFMELNGRSWGSMALSCRRGYAFPAWAVQSRLDPAFRPAVPGNPRHLTCRYLGGELIHLAFVMRGARDKDPRAWPSRREALRDVLTIRRGEAWYNCRRGEGRPGRRYLAGRSGAAPPLEVAVSKVLRVAAHVHSEWSDDAAWSLDAIARSFRRRRYDVVLMCEHSRGWTASRYDDYVEACAAASRRRVAAGPGDRVRGRGQRGARRRVGPRAVLRPNSGHRRAAWQGCGRGGDQRVRSSLATGGVAAVRAQLGPAT